ncbi:hypothetical protein DLJ59_06845 [Micromonospora inaquosa]|uniref:Uncharacterized protein n=1 Tax=Micromonospora inaquosa TaxID=2203716 RepID=A0A3N9XEC1_9ACTN|nr:hypothetical protein DLJ59_06845 [Micromonospora inaquosa]
MSEAFPSLAAQQATTSAIATTWSDPCSRPGHRPTRSRRTTGCTAGDEARCEQAFPARLRPG